MALVSRVLVLIAFLAFATFLELAQGLKCYSCIKATEQDPKDNRPVMLGEYKNDCEVTFGNMVDIPKQSEVWVKKEGKASYDGKTTHTHEIRTEGKVSGRTPDACGKVEKSTERSKTTKNLQKMTQSFKNKRGHYDESNRRNPETFRSIITSGICLLSAFLLSSKRLAFSSLMLLAFMAEQVNAEHKIVDVLTTHADPKLVTGVFAKRGSFKMCKEGWFITHFRVRELPPHPYYPTDQYNMAITEIAFKCKNFAGNQTEWISEAGPSEGTIISPVIGCESGIATGLDMKARNEDFEGTTGNKDKIGMIGFALYCEIDNNEFPRIFSGQFRRGTWMNKRTKQTCPGGSGLCGFRAQIDENSRYSDGSGLNNVEMPCCSNNVCTFYDDWEDVFIFNNLKGKENVHEKFSKTVGTDRAKESTAGGSDEKENHWDVGAKFNLGIFEISGGYGESSKTGYNWESVSSSTKNKAVTRDSAITIPAGAKTILRQVVGKCGGTEIRTEKFQKIDTFADGRENVENFSDSGVQGYHESSLVAVTIGSVFLYFM